MVARGRRCETHDHTLATNPRSRSPASPSRSGASIIVAWCSKRRIIRRARHSLAIGSAKNSKPSARSSRFPCGYRLQLVRWRGGRDGTKSTSSTAAATKTQRPQERERERERDRMIAAEIDIETESRTSIYLSIEGSLFFASSPRCCCHSLTRPSLLHLEDEQSSSRRCSNQVLDWYCPGRPC